MKYFGTDGIRGIAGTEINEKLLKKIANAIVAYYNKHKLKKVLLVGNDSRISSDFILSCLESTLLKHGITTENIGICSSPCLAYLTKKHRYPLGLMLSASHNPKEYNGLKFFNTNGEKVSDEWEQEFEQLMEKPNRFKVEYVKRKNVEKLKKDYMFFLRSQIRNNLNFVLDCANGGTSVICKLVFPKKEKIHCNPLGTNINENSGCTHIEMLKSICIKKKTMGIAFDGDGDRISVVSENGNVFDGDKLLHILSKFFLNKNDKLVGTIYTNSGLEKVLNKRGIKLIRAQVGDKNVYAEMQKNSSVLGGEESGHIIIKPYTNTGDGVLNSIIILNLIQLSNLTIDELVSDYTNFYQARANLKVEKNFKLSESKIKQIKKLEKSGARIIIRPSGTEPVLRVFVEHKNKEIAIKFLEIIKNLIKNSEN